MIYLGGRMIEVKSKEKCCGCAACTNKCPKAAIEMIADDEGFLYPNVDTSVCVDCGLCETVCPILNVNEVHNDVREMYEVQCNDSDALKKSASGGFMKIIAPYILEKNGYMCGAAYDKNNKVEHIIINNKQDLSKLMGSKYVQSEMGDCYKKISELLKKNKLICFSGTPCQVAGLKAYLGFDHPNLILVEVLCAGVPSPRLWNKYLNYQEERYKSKIRNVNFRNKTYGYQCSTMMLSFENGKIYSQSGRIDPMMKLFISGIAKRPICYNCPFKNDERLSDFTIFDGWSAGKLAGIKDNDKGFTAVAIHSNKGKKIFEALRGMKCYCVDYEMAQKSDGKMFNKQPDRCQGRNELYVYLDDHDIDATINHFMPVTKMDIAVERIKPILYKIGLIKMVKKIRQKLE